MNHDVDATLRELAAVGRDGKEFYEYAQLLASGPLRARFARAARAKAELLALVASRTSPLHPDPVRVDTAADPPAHELPTEWRQDLARSRSRLRRTAPETLVPVLDRLEQRVLAHYRTRLAATQDRDTRAALALLLPVLAEGPRALASDAEREAP